MVNLSNSEKKLIEVYKKLRLKEIKNKEQMKQDLTLTEQTVLYNETKEIEREIEKIRNHFSDLFYKRWLKEWDEQNAS
ncbi:MAG: hypothetical protein R3327_04195 [Nitrosopumilaceae archaeon]|nr:hypothetical protein [Nitrosopumilaceae archaeon]